MTMTKTFIASIIFGTNIYMMTYERGYFDPDIKVNPLLHLWSLGVEEQFYIFWPFLISILSKRFVSRAFHCLLAFTIMSFTLNVVCAYVNVKYDFYFPFCRFWQMAVGGLMAFKSANIKNKNIANLISLIGITAIIFSAFFLN